MTFTVENLRESDVEAVINLFQLIINELHAKNLRNSFY